jgi:hypothetical protein
MQGLKFLFLLRKKPIATLYLIPETEILATRNNRLFSSYDIK